MVNIWFSLFLIPAAALSIIGDYLVLKRRPSLLAKPWVTTALFALPPVVVFLVSFLTPAQFPTLSEQEWVLILSLPGSVLPGSYELYRRFMTHIRVTSIALEATSPEEMFNQRMRDPDSFDPFYDGRFSIKQSEQLTEWTPFEISSETSTPLSVRGIFLEVYPPLDTSLPTKYADKPKIFTEFKVGTELPLTASAGHSELLRVSTIDVMKIGFSNELISPHGREGLYMRFGFSTQRKTLYSRRFHFGNYVHFFSLMVGTRLRKKLA